LDKVTPMDYLRGCKRNQLIKIDRAVIYADFYHDKVFTANNQDEGINSKCTMRISYLKFLNTELINVEIKIENAEAFFEFLSSFASMEEMTFILTKTYQQAKTSVKYTKKLRDYEPIPCFMYRSVIKNLHEWELLSIFGQRNFEIDLSGNEFSDLEVLNEADLNVLSLSGNNLADLQPSSFKNQTSLCYLNLSNCSLKEVKAGVFENLLNLIDLNLSRNKLREIDEAAFSDLVNLRKLDLSHNELTSPVISNRFVSQNELEILDLSFNRIESMSDDDASIFAGLNNLSELDLRKNAFEGEACNRSKLVSMINSKKSIQIHK
jgi:hypothetical protein